MERHCSNADQIARWLNDDPRVDRVYFPGLEEHPGHEVANRQMSASGGMVSFVLVGDSEQEARDTVSRTNIFALAESLGGVESLIEHPVSMTHGAIPPEVRKAAGLSDSLIRLSVGIEDVGDLQEDLDAAIG
jgi:cystathionine beta-lyase/cystathionine gamma-synthase